MSSLKNAWCVWAAAMAVALFAPLLLSPTRADEPTPPDRREIWVPTNLLGQVLANEPRAVLLSREQYEKLLRDAGSVAAEVAEPPVNAAVTTAKYTGHIEGAVVSVKGTLTVQVLTEEWASVELSFGDAALGLVQADGAAAFTLPNPADKDATSMLLLHGRGEHQVQVEFSRRITVETNGSHLRAELPDSAATSFELDLPAHTEATGSQPIRLETQPERTRLTATLPANARALDIAWRPAANAQGAISRAAVQLGLSYLIDAESVLASADLQIRTSLGALSSALEFTLPADATVANVMGPELESWAVTPGRLTVRLLPGERARTSIVVALTQPSLGTAAQASIALPVLALTGASRTAGDATVTTGSGVSIREIVPGPTAKPSPLGPHATIAGKWSFDGPPAPAQVRLERLVPRFSADLDTLVDLRTDAIYLDRTITLHEEEGRLFGVALAIPAGEELLDVETPSKLRWRREGARVTLSWSGSSLPGASVPVIKVHTRAEPAGWSAATTAGAPAGAAPFAYPLADLKIENVSHVTGYIAVRGPENLRLEAEASDTLERRDGRTTPVRGDYAWFRRDDFTLRVKVTRRAGEALATVTGYALPLAGVLDLHAQIMWDFRYAGTRTVQVRVPEPLASAFNFESPQIASRTLNGDTWTLTFQKELTGENVVAVDAQIAITRTGDDQSHFQATVPVIEPLNVQRTGGTWAVEANTDTEIELSQTGMNELDALLAPAVAGYQPRHRVIAVYSWLGPKYALALTGTRHAPAEVLHAVLDLCELRSVASTSGGVRTEVTYHVRTAGLQFLDVTLPPGSRLLSLLVESEPVKPVEGRPGDVRVVLPARSDPAAPTTIRLLYEGEADRLWGASGQGLLPAPKLPPQIPVLTTKWHAHLPHGYYLSDWEGRFRPRKVIEPRPLVLAPFALWEGLKSVSTAEVLGSSGIADPRSPDVSPEVLARANRLNANHALSGRYESPDFEAESSSSFLLSNDKDQLSAASPQVQQWFADATGFYDTGRYDLAFKRCEQILNIDPSNIAARKMQEQINKKKYEYAVQGYNQTRSYQMWQLEKAWDRPVRRFKEPGEVDQRAVAEGAARLQQKLERIIIPKLEFRDATIREAIEFLKRKSVALDTEETDPTKKGVNIVLRLDAGVGGGVATPVPPSVPVPVVPGLEPVPGVRPLPQTGGEEARITVSLSSIPLGEALRYVTGLANLKYKVEQFAVTVFPQSMPSDILVTKEWKVPPGFLSGVPAPGGPENNGQIKRIEAKDYLMASGVTFPVGASAIFLPSSSRLIVKNTQENIDLVDAITETAGISFPVPVIAPPAEQARRVGLLPMELELPVDGIELAFEAFGAPEDLRFQYAEDGSRARRLWLCFVAGALAGLFFAGRRPWWRTAWAALALSAIPLCLFPSTMAVCNLLLGGWLVSVVMQRLARRLAFAPRPPVRVPAAASLLLVLVFVPAGARAEETEKKEPETVIVPYDPEKPPTEQKPDRLYVPYERFLSLWEAAKINRASQEIPAAPVEYALTSARYEGRAEERALNFTAHFDLLTGQPWMKVVLPFQGVGISSLSLDNVPAALTENAVLVEKPGRHVLTVVFQVARAPGQTDFQWRIPRSSASRVTLTLPRPELTATIEPSDGVIEQAVAPGRIVTAAVGAATDLKIRLRTLDAATARAEPVEASIQQLVQVTAAGEEAEARLAFDLGASALGVFTIYLDPTVELVSLSAPNLQSWKLQSAAGRQALELKLTQPARQSYAVQLSTHRSAATLARQGAMPALSAAAQRSETTSTTLLATPNLEVTPLPAAGLRQIPNEASRANWQTVATYAGRGSLGYRVAPAPARREAQVDYLYQIGRRQVELFASFRFTRHGDDLYEVPLDLPPGFTVETVASPRAHEWWRAGDRLVVRFRDAQTVPDVIPLVVYLVHRETAAPDTLDLRPIGLPGFRKVTGGAVLAAHKGVDLSLAVTGQASEVAPEKVAADYQVLPPLERKRGITFTAGAFAAQVKLRVVPPRFLATWETHAEAHESWLALSTRVRLTMRQGSVDHASFSLPAALPEARVTSPEVRETRSRVDGDRRLYDLDFQNDVYSEVEFTFELEVPHTGAAAVPTPLFPDAQRTTGWLVIENGSEGEMRLQTSGVDPTTQAELPWTSTHARPTRLFRVVSETWNAKVEVERLEKAAGRVAFCAYADLYTALRSDGTEWNRAVWHLQNRALQFLPVRLPAGAELMSARVAGESVRADAATIDGAAAILIPLIKTKPGELSYDVEAVYRIAHPPLDRETSRTLDDPDLLGITVERTFWHLWLPDGYLLRHSDGNLERVLAEVTAADKLDNAVQELKQLSSVVNSKDLDDATRTQARDNFRQLQVQYDKLNQSVDEMNSRGREEGGKNEAQPAKGLKGKEAAAQNAYVANVRSKASSDWSVEVDNIRKGSATIPQVTASTSAMAEKAPRIAGNNTFNFQTRAWTRNGSPEPVPGTEVTANTNNGSRLFLNDNVVLNNTYTGGTVVLNSGNLQVGAELKPAPAQTIENSSVALNTARGNIVANTYSGTTTLSGGTLALPATPSAPEIQALVTTGPRLSLAGAGQPSVTLSGRNTADANGLPPPPAAPAEPHVSRLSVRPSATPSPAAPPPVQIPGLEPAPGAAPAPADAMKRMADLTAGMPVPAAAAGADAMPATAPATAPPPPQKPAPPPDRRITLAVDFPTEGEALHFKKIKAAGTLEISVDPPATTPRLRNTAILAAAALVLLLLQRRTAARYSRAS